MHTSRLNHQEKYAFSRTQTWKALVSILKSYPIKTIDAQKGYIETKTLKGNDFWKAPHKKNKNTNGLSAVIKIYLFYKKPYSIVEIQKEVYQQTSFFSDPKKIKSDLLEEQSLFYRLERELSIRKHLNSSSS